MTHHNSNKNGSIVNIAQLWTKQTNYNVNQGQTSTLKELKFPKYVASTRGQIQCSLSFCSQHDEKQVKDTNFKSIQYALIYVTDRQTDKHAYKTHTHTFHEF